MHNDRAQDWLNQAENDFLFAENALASCFFSQCCFICQQSAEKALKAMAYRRGAKMTVGHSLMKLCQALTINGTLLQAAGTLDQYYISARYPDALPGGAPFELFSQEQARQALGMVEHFLQAARAELSA